MKASLLLLPLAASNVAASALKKEKGVFTRSTQTAVQIHCKNGKVDTWEPLPKADDCSYTAAMGNGWFNITTHSKVNQNGFVGTQNITEPTHCPPNKDANISAPIYPCPAKGPKSTSPQKSSAKSLKQANPLTPLLNLSTHFYSKVFP